MKSRTILKTIHKWMLLFFPLLHVSSCLASGGSEVGNGGGLAEKNITFAYLNLDRLVDLCFQAASCRLTPTEAKVIENIRTTLPQERKKSDQLVFSSGQKNPDFFKIDGVIRVAKTGDHVGDSIFINTDLLYNLIQENEYRAIDIPLAASILIHEFGHHQGLKDHASLDVLGSKLQAFLLMNRERTEFWNSKAALVTIQLNHVHSDAEKLRINSFDEVLLENESQLVSITDRIKSAMSCPKIDSGKNLLGLRIYNLHSERGTTFDAKTQLLKKPFRAWYIESCETGKESDHGDVEIKLTFKKKSKESFEFIPTKTTIRQFTCSTDPSVCK